jgi:hypothetical protein
VRKRTGPLERNSTKVLASCHDRALRTEGLELQGFKMLVNIFGRFGTQASSRHHEHKTTLDRRRNCTKTNKMRYLTLPSSPRDSHAYTCMPPLSCLRTSRTDWRGCQIREISDPVGSRSNHNQPLAKIQRKATAEDFTQARQPVSDAQTHPMTTSAATAPVPPNPSHSSQPLPKLYQTS